MDLKEDSPFGDQDIDLERGTRKEGPIKVLLVLTKPQAKLFTALVRVYLPPAWIFFRRQQLPWDLHSYKLPHQNSKK